MDDDFILRLKQLIEYKSISNNKFAEIIGVSSAQMSHMLNGKNFGIDKMLRIFSSFPEISPAWLIKGEEPMLVPKKTMGALDFVFQQAKYWGEMDRALNKLAAPGCEACKIKDMMLANQQQTIQSQEKIIHTLERDLHTCKQSISKKQ
jgi:hypothetical protein